MLAAAALVTLVSIVAARPAATARAILGAPCDGLWRVVPTFDHSQSSGEIDSLNGVAAPTASDGWAVGSWTRYPDQYTLHTLVERWNRRTGAWADVPSPDADAVNSYLNGVAGASRDDVWAVGGSDRSGPPYTSLVEHWDGRSWSIVSGASFQGVLYGVTALGANDVWAVGTSDFPGRVLIEHWDGTSWSVSYPAVAGGAGGELRSISPVARDDIWAVGYFWDDGVAGLVERTLAMHFHGRAWRQVSTPSPLTGSDDDQNWLASVSAAASDDVWAVGFYRGLRSNGTSTAGHALVERWDGTRWRMMRGADPGPAPGGNALWGVAAVARDDVWAVGNAGGVLDDFDTTTPLVEHWDGTSWMHVLVPGSGSSLFALAAGPGRSGLSAVGVAVKPVAAPRYQGTFAEHVCPD